MTWLKLNHMQPYFRGMITTWKNSQENQDLGRALRAPNPDFIVAHLRRLPSRRMLLIVGLSLGAGLSMGCGAINPDSNRETLTSDTESVTVDAASAESTSTEDTGEASSPDPVALAEHLSSIDARMYGAYWCPHCSDQKAMFGEAFSTIDYVECDPSGENARPEMCQSAGIQGYPTWEINGELYPGVRSLADLAALSGYES